jgi:signal transduction histidine kinase
MIGPAPAGTLDDLVPALVAAGQLCVVGLTRRSHPSASWLATIGAVAVVTVDLATYARGVRPAFDGDAWRAMSILVSLTALLGVATATAYAATRRRLPQAWVALGGFVALAATAGAAIWATANASDVTVTTATGSPLGSLGLVTRAFLVSTLALTVLGAIGDALPAAERARRATQPAPASLRDRAPATIRWLRAFVDELAPGRARARRAALAERSRFARDLHADVMPGLRRILAEAEREVAPEQLARSLRAVLEDVEAVGTRAHPIQLEVGGLVPALEWLAERVEARSDIRIDLEIAEAAPASSPPDDVAAAAFRVATLALDNVVRHAPGSSACVTVAAHGDRVDLTIGDDGPGLSSNALASALANGRRGIADMGAEGSACGAKVEIGSGPGGTGTLVTFAWSRSQAR